MTRPSFRHVDNHVYVRFPQIGRYVCQDIPEGSVAAEKVYQNALTLNELRLFSQLMLRSSIPVVNVRGEWTADFVDYGLKEGRKYKALENGYIQVVYISRPRAIWQKKGVWRYKGGNKYMISLPPSGWIIPDISGKIYHEATGTPLATTQILEEAGASNYAYFWRSNIGEGVISVNRECERMQNDAFEIAIVQKPDFAHDNIGYRPVV